MILTIARCRVRPGFEQAFLAAHQEGAAHVLGTPGCRSARIVRGVADPDRYVLIAEWADTPPAAPLAGWQTAVGEYLQGSVVVEQHTQLLHPQGEL